MTHDLVVIIGAQYLFIVVPAVALIYWIVAPAVTKRYLVVVGIATGVVSVLIGQIIAHFYFDVRPFMTGHFPPLIPHAPDNGFPSDHTLLSSIIAATITPANVRLGIVLWIIAALVGVARVSAGLHHPIDVVGSICIAAAIGAVIHWIFRGRRERVWPRS